MKCPRCQAENNAGARFCEDCGARLEAACPSCGIPVTPGKRFCRSCGAALTTEPAGRFASPEFYTPKHLVEKILISRTALESERKQVSVLFADLKGSMELLADRDPEDARKLLDPVLERMMEAVHRYEGTVNQIMGDGIMALFGAPLAYEDHAVRACYAALRMQESVKRYAEEVHRTAGVPLHIRVGVNSGEVVVRSIGSDLHMDYTAVGQTTHLASRLEQMAMPGAILISPETLNLAEGYVVVKALGQRPIKGLEAPIEVFEVVGAGTVRSRLQAAAARGLTRFVGRDAEVEQLRHTLERAGAGHGQVVALVGEPGVGKSRLIWEFTHSRRTHGWLLLESGSASYGKATAYLPVIDLLKAYFEIELTDDGRKICEKVTGKLLTLDEALRPTLPAFLALLDVSVADAAWQTLDSRQRRQCTQEAVKRLVVRESQVQPLCLVFEDLHWTDSETRVFLDGLVESLPTARILLLVNYRPEYQHGWGGKSYYNQLRIDPLSAESAEELLHALLGEDASVQPLTRLLIERTEGNPFFLEESVLTLVETGVLGGQRGAYRLARPFVSVQVPATVQTVLAARIDRLRPEDKALLQTAAIIGKDVPFALLKAIAELPEDALLRGLAHLKGAEFLYEAELFPELEYTFKHALTHEVAYAGLLQDRRRTLHARIVEAIEALSSDQLTEQVDRLAHHAFRGEQWEKAVSYLRQAGAKAAARSAHREAVTCFEQALVALTHLPEGRATLEQAIDLRFDLRSSLYPLAELGRILACLRDAETLAKALGDQRRLGKLADYTSHYFWWIGDYERAIAAGERALAVAGELGDFVLEIVANLYLGRAYLSVGQYRRAMDLLERNVALLHGDLSQERFGQVALTSVSSRTYLVWCLAEMGSFADAAVRAQEGVRIAEAVDHAYSTALACFGAGRLHLSKGELPEAIRMLERSLSLSRLWDIPVWFPLIASALGSAYTISGRVAEALPLLAEAAEQAVARGIKVAHSLGLTCLAEANLKVNRTEDAIELGERALGLSRHHKERGHEAHALRLLGDIASHRDTPDIDKAEDYYREAMATADELGMRPLVAHCHLGLGKLYRRTGKRQEAQEHLTTATAMYREMDMQFWLEQAEVEMKELA